MVVFPSKVTSASVPKGTERSIEIPPSVLCQRRTMLPCGVSTLHSQKRSCSGNAGFTVNFCDQAYVTDHYLDVGALVWYAKVLPWEFGNFTVESCLPQLDALDALCEKQGYIPSVQHRFMLIVRNRKPKE